jgi:hypothetical protein
LRLTSFDITLKSKASASKPPTAARSASGRWPASDRA